MQAEQSRIGQTAVRWDKAVNPFPGFVQLVQLSHAQLQVGDAQQHVERAEGNLKVLAKLECLFPQLQRLIVIAEPGVQPGIKLVKVRFLVLAPKGTINHQGFFQVVAGCSVVAGVELEFGPRLERVGQVRLKIFLARLVDHAVQKAHRFAVQTFLHQQRAFDRLAGKQIGVRERLFHALETLLHQVPDLLRDALPLRQIGRVKNLSHRPAIFRLAVVAHVGNAPGEVARLRDAAKERVLLRQGFPGVPQDQHAVFAHGLARDFVQEPLRLFKPTGIPQEIRAIDRHLANHVIRMGTGLRAQGPFALWRRQNVLKYFFRLIQVALRQSHLPLLHEAKIDVLQMLQLIDVDPKRVRFLQLFHGDLRPLEMFDGFIEVTEPSLDGAHPGLRVVNFRVCRRPRLDNLLKPGVSRVQFAVQIMVESPLIRPLPRVNFADVVRADPHLHHLAGIRRKGIHADAAGVFAFPGQFAAVDAAVVTDVQNRIVQRATNHGNFRADQSHLFRFPFPHGHGRAAPQVRRHARSAKLEQVGNAQFRIEESELRKFSGALGNRADEHVLVRQVLRHQVRQPVGQIAVVAAIRADGLKNLFEIGGALFLIFQGLVIPRGRLGLRTAKCAGNKRQSADHQNQGTFEFHKLIPK